MKFEEARERLREIASGRFSSVQYGENYYQGRTMPEVKLYVAEIGWTETFRTFEQAFENLDRMISGEPYEYEGPEFDPEEIVI
jgi:O-methyltransferase involved in polyketide biosynthesis